MPSTGAGKRRYKSKGHAVQPMRQPEGVPDAGLGQIHAIQLAEAIDHLEDDMFLPSGEGYDDPGLDEMPDEDAFDMSEYEEDGPFRDVDESEESWDDGNPLEFPGPGLDPFPTAQVILDITGDIILPVESWLQDRLAGTDMPDDKLIRRWEAARLLRQLAERMVQEWKEILLDPEKGVTDLPAPTQAEFAGRAGISNKSFMSRCVSSRYMATPYWGIIPLSAFFRFKEAREEAWDRVIEEAVMHIQSEDPEHPLKTEVLWNEVRGRLSDLGIAPPSSNRMLRNRLNERGVPVLPGRRKEIYLKVKKWWGKNGKPATLPRSSIPKIKTDLILHHGLFASNAAKECRGPLYAPFVEERIARVFEDLKVSLTP